MSNRKAVIDFIEKELNNILPGNVDAPRIRAYLEGLSEKDFAAMMMDFKTRKKYVTLTVPHTRSREITQEKLNAVAKRLGFSFFKRVWIGGTGNVPDYLSKPTLVVLSPIRLASQRLSKKMSIPKHYRVINQLTGQPTGISKGASVSYPEIRQAVAMGLEKAVVECIKYRGGDIRGGAALNATLMAQGRANLQTLNHFSSGVVSTITLSTLLSSMHLKNNL